MCVAVILAPGTVLSADEIDRMAKANGDGAGFAWADGAAVHWLKALHPDPDMVAALLRKRQEHARLLHFRLSTVGGVRVELCHPFEVGPAADPRAQGSGAKVLIHNGHWGSWVDIFKLYKEEQILPDNGPWSDTRFAAWLASQDTDWLSLVGGKVATLEGDGTIRMWGDWKEHRKGLLVSNTHWESHTYNYTRSGAHRTSIGWGWTDKEWDEWIKHKEDAEISRAQAAKELEDEQKRKEAKEREAKELAEKSRMGSGPRHWQVPGTGDTSSRNFGRALGPGAGEGNVPGNSTVSGSQTDQKGKADGTQGYNGARGNIKGQIFDHTPFQCKATEKWWWIPWSCEPDGTPRFVEITAVRASEILEQITPKAPVGK